MARRRRPVQEEIVFRRCAGKRGGPRTGAGRPPRGPRSSERHKRRPPLRPTEPVHVVIRTVAAVGSLRRRRIYHALQQALLVVARREEQFRVAHVSIQGSHVHLLAEASDRIALARGMQALQISAARRINAALSRRRSDRRRGTVFPDRYHADIIYNRRQVRNTLAYVLNNWRRHGADSLDGGCALPVDPFSSGPTFDGWRGPLRLDWPRTYEPLPVSRPRSWLLAVGWRVHGLIDPTERPAGRRGSSRTRASDRPGTRGRS